MQGVGGARATRVSRQRGAQAVNRPGRGSLAQVCRFTPPGCRRPSAVDRPSEAPALVIESPRLGCPSKASEASPSGSHRPICECRITSDVQRGYRRSRSARQQSRSVQCLIARRASPVSGPHRSESCPGVVRPLPAHRQAEIARSTGVAVQCQPDRSSCRRVAHSHTIIARETAAINCRFATSGQRAIISAVHRRRRRPDRYRVIGREPECWHRSAASLTAWEMPRLLEWFVEMVPHQMFSSARCAVRHVTSDHRVVDARPRAADRPKCTSTTTVRGE